MKNEIIKMVISAILGAGFTTGLANGECPIETWDLTAGQTIDVGSVSVINDAERIYIQYDLDYDQDSDGQIDAEFGTLHVWVGSDLALLPSNPQGIPVPGQFCNADGGACIDASGETSYTVEISFEDLNIVDVDRACDLPLYIVTHAEVVILDPGSGEVVSNETAFGGGQPGPGNRWWFYDVYNVCCQFGTPSLDFCETAFAKGNWVWTTGRKSNPENLPSLRLTKNRWGWAIKLEDTGNSNYEIWSGAGLNNTSKGTLVGTLAVAWDGTNVSVTYNLDSGYCLEEVHIYSDDQVPITTAPGQFGFVSAVDSSEFTKSLELVDEDGDGCVWLIAHAVVCACSP